MKRDEFNPIPPLLINIPVSRSEILRAEESYKIARRIPITQTEATRKQFAPENIETVYVKIRGSFAGAEHEQHSLDVAMARLRRHRYNAVDLSGHRDLLPIHWRQATHRRG